MAHKRSARKRLRQSLRKRLANKSKLSAMRTQIKKFSQAIEYGNIEEAKSQFGRVTSIIDKTASRNIIHKNMAARIISRLTRKLNALETAKQSGQPA